MMRPTFVLTNMVEDKTRQDKLDAISTQTRLLCEDCYTAAFYAVYPVSV